MALRIARPPTEAGTDAVAAHRPAAKEPLLVLRQPALTGGPAPTSLRRTSLLALQRAAGNAAVVGGVARLARVPAPSVQRCGSVPPDECPCHAEDPSAETEPAGPVAQRQATGAVAQRAL